MKPDNIDNILVTGGVPHDIVLIGIRTIDPIIGQMTSKSVLPQEQSFVPLCSSVSTSISVTTKVLELEKVPP